MEQSWELDSLYYIIEKTRNFELFFLKAILEHCQNGAVFILKNKQSFEIFLFLRNTAYGELNFRFRSCMFLYV